MRRHTRVVHDHWQEEYFPCTHVPLCAPRNKWEKHPTHMVRRTVPCSADQPGGDCRRWISNGRNMYCGCRLCTDHWGMRMTRRRGRHEQQRLCRALRKDRYAGDDVPTRLPVKDSWASYGVRGRVPDPAE